MRFSRGLRIGLVMVMTAAAAGARAQTAAELVEQLGHDSYRLREDASQKLWGMAEKALDELGEAERHQDPEIAYRARILLQRIQTGILPGTPQEIVDLVQRYHRSGPATKKTVMEQLRKAEAFPQILRLYRFEKDPEARQECAELVNESVIPAVDAAFAGRDPEGAEALLELAPETEANFRRLASLYRTRGKLDAKLAEYGAAIDRGDVARMEPAEERKFRAMHLALLRSKGDVASSRKVAEELEREDLLAVFALFDGNPVPYLEWYMSREQEPVSRLHTEVVKERWLGNAEAEAKLLRAIRAFAKDGGEDSEAAVTSLLLLGQRDEVLPLLKGDLQESAFEYYDTVELPRKAIAITGYTGDAAAKKKWLDERWADLKAEWDEADVARMEILEVARFLQRRGATKEAAGIINAASDIAEAEGQEDWLEFLGQLADGDDAASFELAFELAAGKLKEDGEDADAAVLMSSLFGEGDAAWRLWDRLGKVTETEPEERILLLGGLYGRSPVRMDELDAALAALLEGADEAAAGEQRQMLVDLLEPAMTRDAATDVVELLVRLGEIDGRERWAKLLATYYGYLAEWQKAADAWRMVVETDETNDPFYLAAYAGALTRIGKRPDAERMILEVEMRSLDEPLKLLRLAMTLQAWGAREDAERYWRQLVMTNPPTDWYWRSSAMHGVDFAKHRGDWREAAAFAEVQSLGYLRSNTSLMTNPVVYLRSRLSADLFRGLALADEGDRPGARGLLEPAFETLIGDGVLADDFFPLVRKAGLTRLHDRLFAKGFARLKESIEHYPEAHNTYNGAAWLASRASRELDLAERQVAKALELRPRQAAYLDTMAEVWFAKRDREKAVEWSRKALRESQHANHSLGGGTELREQFERFKNGEFPTP